MLSDESTKTNLQPCPFCGSLNLGFEESPNYSAETNYYGVTVMCECGAQGATGNNNSEATIKWNTRFNKVTEQKIRLSNQKSTQN
jgi:Lar family restriction alleviation protein